MRLKIFSMAPRGDVLFKIGDFSRLSLVSVKALRYYDEIGLLKPRQVDEDTGYRYYSADQLPRLNRILALKDLGLNLEQVAQVLSKDLSSDQLRGMLRLRQAEIQQRMRDDALLMARMEVRLRHIEMEGHVPDQEVVIKQLPPQLIMSVRKVIPDYASVVSLWEMFCSQIEAKNLKAAGPLLEVCHDREYRERDVDVELAIPIAQPLDPPPGFGVRELAGVEQAACLIHQGPYEELMGSYHTLGVWIQSHNYRIVGLSREVYLSGVEAGPPESYVTEIQIPVEPVA